MCYLVAHVPVPAATATNSSATGVVHSVANTAQDPSVP